MNKEVKYQSERVTLLAGVASGQEKVIQLDASFDRVVGYTVHSVSQDADDKFSLGLTNRIGVLQDRTFQNDHIADTSVPMDKRFKEIYAKADGNQITIQVEPVEALTADLIIDVVFKLEKDHKGC